MRSLVHNIAVTTALASAVQSANVNGSPVDLLGFDSVVFVVSTGAIAGSGDFSAKVQESDASGSGYADAAESDVISNAPATLTADGAFKLGYVGSKRFVRLVLTKNGGTSIAAGAVAIKGNPSQAPAA